MTDFTHKYRQAVDSLEYSPDFKDRTAAMMKALRDRSSSENISSETDNSLPHREISVEVVNAASARRKNTRRLMSVMGAAAACIALCVTTVRTGVLDGDSDIAVVTETAAAPEGTDVIPGETWENKSTSESVFWESLSNETAVPAENTDGAVLQHAAETSAAVTSADHAEEPLPAKALDNSEEPPAEEEVISGNTAAQTSPAVTAPVTSAVTTIAAVTSPAPSHVNASQGTGADVSLPTGNAEYVPPAAGKVYDEESISDDESYRPATERPVISDGESDEIIADPVSPAANEPEAAETGIDSVTSDTDTIPLPVDDYDYDGEAEAAYEPKVQPDSLDDPAYNYKGAVGYDFSAYDEAKKFDRKDAYAVITPLADDYDEQSGKYISHDPGEVRGTVKMRRLISAAALYAEDGSWEYVSSPPAQARYIIDFADESGNSLRAYAGEGFICYAFTPTGGEAAGQLKYYYFTLSEEESGKLEELLAENVK